MAFSVNSFLGTPSTLTSGVDREPFLLIFIHEVAHRRQIQTEERFDGAIPFSLDDSDWEKFSTGAWTKIDPKDWLVITDAEIAADPADVARPWWPYTYYKDYGYRMEMSIKNAPGNNLSEDDRIYVGAAINRGYTTKDDGTGDLDLFDSVLTELFARIKSIVAVNVGVNNLNDLFGSNADIKSLFTSKMIIGLDRFVWGLPNNEGRYG